MRPHSGRFPEPCRRFAPESVRLSVRQVSNSVCYGEFWFVNSKN